MTYDDGTKPDLAEPHAYTVDMTQLQPYEAAALVLTLLAEAPKGEPGTSLDQRFGEACAYVIQHIVQTNPKWAEEHQLLRPIHALVPLERASEAGRRMATAIEHRLVAGRMAIAFIDAELLGNATRLPPGVKRLSQNAMARFVADGNKTATESNIKNRSFYPSMPVIHLCAALAVLRVALALPKEEAAIVDRLIADMKLLRALVLTAEALEAPVIASKKLNVSEASIIRLRWIDG